MTVDEIFSNIATHMIKGITMHNHMASLYGFLNLRGYQTCQEWHYYEESRNYRSLWQFYLTHFNKLIEERTDEPVAVIPSGWYRYTRMDVDPNTKRSTIKDTMKKWVNWEQETKSFLELCYTQLCELGEIDAAIHIQQYIKDVGEELAGAQSTYIDLESMGYDIVYIIDQQPTLCEQYKYGKEE